MDQPLLVISGPTAAGKSALALELAQMLDGEIISCDSALVYRGFNIGSAKPSSAERALVPHHLIDICEPNEQYNTARFREECLLCIEQLRKRGKKPIIVGGSTLYLSALLSGLSQLPEGEPKLRAQLLSMTPAQRLALLKEKDPIYAHKVHAHDTLRISRALEIILTTGCSLAESYERGNQKQTQIAATVLNLTLPHELLRLRIEQRTRQMIAMGLVDEVRELQKSYPLNAAPFASVGYAQTVRFLRGDLTPQQLEEEISTATRQLAKRQRTFWRNEPAKRGWISLPDMSNDYSDKDVIQYYNDYKSARVKGVQRGFACYLWNSDQICNAILENQEREQYISVYTIQKSL